MKTCRCGAKYTAAEWKKLRYVGVQQGVGERIELRNCAHCRSTLGKTLPPPAAAQEAR